MWGCCGVACKVGDVGCTGAWDPPVEEATRSAAPRVPGVNQGYPTRAPPRAAVSAGPRGLGSCSLLCKAATSSRRAIDPRRRRAAGLCHSGAPAGAPQADAGRRGAAKPGSAPHTPVARPTRAAAPGAGCSEDTRVSRTRGVLQGDGDGRPRAPRGGWRRASRRTVSGRARTGPRASRAERTSQPCTVAASQRDGHAVPTDGKTSHRPVFWGATSVPQKTNRNLFLLPAHLTCPLLG